jgi:hypothetical protein
MKAKMKERGLAGKGPGHSRRNRGWEVGSRKGCMNFAVFLGHEEKIGEPLGAENFN